MNNENFNFLKRIIAALATTIDIKETIEYSRYDDTNNKTRQSNATAIIRQAVAIVEEFENVENKIRRREYK